VLVLPRLNEKYCCVHIVFLCLSEVFFWGWGIEVFGNGIGFRIRIAFLTKINTKARGLLILLKDDFICIISKKD
jgi:hypothetical protein